MRHLNAGRKFGRNTSHRRAMFRNLAGNLVLHEKIETTDAKAKELRRTVERLITRAARLGDELTVDTGKLNDEQREKVVARRVHAQRLVASYLPKKLVKTNSDGSTEEVDIVLDFAIACGASLLKPAHKTDYGGYSGYFGDPDNHPWEVVVAPGIEVSEDRRVHLPD